MARLGNWLQGHASILLISLAALGGAGYFLRHRLGISQFISGLVDKVPFIRKTRADLAAGPASEVLAALIEADTPIAEALEISAGIAVNPAKRAFASAAECIRDGATVGASLGAQTSLPIEIRLLASIGEVSGALGKSFAEAGQLCQARALRRISSAAAIAGPALVVIIGGVIAAMMILVLTGLTSIGEAAL